MVEMVSRPYERAFEKHALANPDVLCISADLTSSCEIDKFRDNHPDQFLSMGMAGAVTVLVTAPKAKPQPPAAPKA